MILGILVCVSSINFLLTLTVPWVPAKQWHDNDNLFSSSWSFIIGMILPKLSISSENEWRKTLLKMGSESSKRWALRHVLLLAAHFTYSSRKHNFLFAQQQTVNEKSLQLSQTEPSRSSHEPSFKTTPPNFLLKEHSSHLFSRLVYGSP